MDGAGDEWSYRALGQSLGRPPPADAREVVGLVNEVVSGDHGAVEVVAALAALRQVREELTAWEPILIAAARQRGVSWAELAPALGVTSRQAAERRFLRLRPSATGEANGEDRVRAERDRRAGDRAVHLWARENAAILRRLAGQVGGLGGLSAPAQARADRVYEALGDDDPLTLLSPLADARPHLTARHPALAGQIDDITQQLDRLRRDTTRRRNQE